MTQTVLAEHLIDERPARQAKNDCDAASLNDAIAYSAVWRETSFAQMICILRALLVQFDMAPRCGALSSHSMDGSDFRFRVRGWRELLLQEALRLWQMGRISSLQPIRTNGDFTYRDPLAIKGEALIYAPTLVAGMVMSE